MKKKANSQYKQNFIYKQQSANWKLIVAYR
jgi:hypothetical protein